MVFFFLVIGSFLIVFYSIPNHKNSKKVSKPETKQEIKTDNSKKKEDVETKKDIDLEQKETKEDEKEESIKTEEKKSEETPEEYKENTSNNSTNQTTKENEKPKINENNNNNPKPNPGDPVTYTTKTEKETIKENIKYGVKLTKTVQNTYKVGTDGSKVLENSVIISQEYDYKGFNASTSQLQAEASNLMNQNIGTYNQILVLVNNLRAENGKAPLTLDNSLTLAATIRSTEMAYSNIFDHIRPNGTACYSILGELGIGWSGVAENIAAGQTNAQSVFNAWNNSPAHRENMLANYSKIGIGKAVSPDGIVFWTQLFTT